ncbi:hypothetical protein [Actinophytocola sp.]|uniref:hypothetical protein n=1 Tax=Actinophytocola sp. TaxID=1872138 RepID=UPI002D7FD39A|nr:hypothetical protein [Actinophytocola sp.]HET9144097.1 hypothetical protein [Actinophytocola sp.]
MRDLRHEVLREIRRVDAEIKLLVAMEWPDKMTRIDAWLDRRLRLMLRRDQLETLGFTVTDRRRLR